MFKVNNKDTRIMTMTSFWYLYGGSQLGEL